MADRGDLVDALSCQEFVELFTAYLDGALNPETEHRLVDHLSMCKGCAPYLDQFRQTIRTLAAAEEMVPDRVRNALLEAFRDLPLPS